MLTSPVFFISKTYHHEALPPGGMAVNPVKDDPQANDVAGECP